MRLVEWMARVVVYVFVHLAVLPAEAYQNYDCK